MKSFFMFLFLVPPLIFSCQKSKSLAKQEDENNLQSQRLEIITLANSKPCTDASQWGILSMKSILCQGTTPESFAYNKNVDVVQLQQLISAYNKAIDAYVQKWKPGIVPCPLIIAPTKVACVDGKAQLDYTAP